MVTGVSPVSYMILYRLFNIYQIVKKFPRPHGDTLGLRGQPPQQAWPNRHSERADRALAKLRRVGKPAGVERATPAPPLQDARATRRTAGVPNGQSI